MICGSCGENIAEKAAYASTEHGFQHLDCYALPEIGQTVNSAMLRIERLEREIKRLTKRDKEAFRLLECYLYGLPHPKGHSEAVRKWLKAKL